MSNLVHNSNVMQSTTVTGIGTLKIFYQIVNSIEQDTLNYNNNDDVIYNYLEIPDLLLLDREVYLIDILRYLRRNPVLYKEVGLNYTFYVEISPDTPFATAKYLPLTVSSVIPIRRDHSVSMKWCKSSSPPLSSKNQFVHFHERSKSLTSQYIQEFGALYQQHKNNAKSKTSNLDNSSAAGTGVSGGNPFFLVSEEAAETAKEVASAAARSLFSFAANVSKSVIDVASSVSATIAAGGSGGLSPGSTFVISKVKVTIQSQLSEGGFGIVYHAIDSNTNQQYALKQLLCQSSEQVKEAHNEIKVLEVATKGNCQEIVELIDYSSTAIASNDSAGNSSQSMRQVLLLFPLYPKGTAWDAIERSANSPVWPFPEQKALYLIYTVAQALQFLHDRGLAHRDIKPHNILLSEGSGRGNSLAEVGTRLEMGQPVLMDLGSVCPARLTVQSRSDALKLEDEAASKTSAAYRSPELTTAPLPPCNIDERVDSWGLGCTMYALAFGRSPFETPKEGVLRLAIMNAKYSIPPNRTNSRGVVYSVEYINMVEKLLSLDLNQRPYMTEVIAFCEDRLLHS